MFNVGDLRNEILRIAAAVKVERDIIAVTKEPFSDDWKRVRHIWANAVHEEQVRAGWVRLMGAEDKVEKVIGYCDVAIRQLHEYERSL